MMRMQQQQEQHHQISPLRIYQQIRSLYEVIQQNFKIANQAVFILQQRSQYHPDTTKFWILISFREKEVYLQLKLVDSFRNKIYLECIDPIKIAQKYNLKVKVKDNCMAWKSDESNFQIQKSFQYEITPKQLITQIQTQKNSLKKLSQNLQTKQISLHIHQMNSKMTSKINGIKKTVKRLIQSRNDPNYYHNNKQLLNSNKQKQLYDKYREKVKNTKYVTQEYLLNGIEIYQNVNRETQQKIQGTFSHITKCSLKYQILNSLHPETHKLISTQQKKQGKNKQETMIMKKKCQVDCTLKHKFNILENMRVFQDQVKILKMFRDQKHPFISPHFINKQANCLFTKYEKMNLAEYKQQLQNKSLTEKNSIIPTVLEYMMIFKCLSRALIFLSQQKKIIHRDLKPQNILLDKSRNPKIIDFGSATTTTYPICTQTTTMATQGQPQPPLQPQQQPQPALHQKLYSTKPYHIFYNSAYPDLRKKYTQMQYERHQLFDIYSLGVIIEQYVLHFIKQSGCDNSGFGKTGFIQILKDSIKYVVDGCKQMDPNRRFTANQVCYILYIVKEFASMVDQQIYKKVFCLDQTK